MKRSIVVMALLFVMGSWALSEAADDPSIQGAVREDIQAAMSDLIDGNTVDGQFAIYDAVAGELKRLTFDNLHEGIVKKAGVYVSCADFLDEGGNTYDLDFLVLEDGDDHVAVEAIVHAVNGEKRVYHLEGN
jgi:hypothetical protein